MNNKAPARGSPELPSIVKIPVVLMPMRLKAGVISGVMNALFANPLKDQELAFLKHLVINILVTDADLRFSLRLDQNRLCAASEVANADLTIEGTVYTFLLLTTRKEDADTLFFRRQLKTSGDTELGLYVKNFLDGLEPESIPWHGVLDPIMRSSLLVADSFDKIRSRLSGNY